MLQKSLQRLRDFHQGFNVNGTTSVERDDVVAHATVSAALQHWPNRCPSEWKDLIHETIKIRELENSRWMRQRRIALAKLAATLSQPHSV